jgi:extradiol dioxygenase family protein
VFGVIRVFRGGQVATKHSDGRTGEQWTMFFRDPAGNALEFKAFADDSAVFAG